MFQNSESKLDIILQTAKGGVRMTLVGQIGNLEGAKSYHSPGPATLTSFPS